ncbi:hypothetical protein [Natrarchaeobaculum aegyptiacum]|uniref:DUF2800 domain-containing protein n=1 Tax=Natrarchaeobaculum aegyptiacum TaxID=745377 RepID=A0A2Z2HRZ0_9EURY|nr:hypothetical protein [Natrarchaeobaculum aegyptiacum]ARS89910.1 hypothetical protein B1756_09335 [Natrarchaeobaculum aegyptiacum]
MSATEHWYTLLEELESLPPDVTLLTPLSHSSFQISDVQEHRVVIEFDDRDEKRPLQREQFETLFRRIRDENGRFDLERLPPDGDPYPAVVSLHPHYEIDEEAGAILETDDPSSSHVLDDTGSADAHEPRTEPELDIYADALLLVDTLERHDVTAMEDLETGTLVTLYTLLSDVQRNANDLRTDVSDVLLNRLHHDRPVSGPFGSVQRTTRRNRSLKDEDEVFDALEEAGIDRERVLGLDRSKVDDALEVTDLSESAVYEIEDRDYVRKADVDEDVKESRLQGLKEQLAATGGEDAETLRREIDALEERINDLTSFQTGADVDD